MKKLWGQIIKKEKPQVLGSERFVISSIERLNGIPQKGAFATLLSDWTRIYYGVIDLPPLFVSPLTSVYYNLNVKNADNQ